MCVRPITAPKNLPSVVSSPWAWPAGAKRPMGGLAHQNFLGGTCRLLQTAVLELAQPRSIQAALVNGTSERAQQSMSLDNIGKMDA